MSLPADRLGPIAKLPAKAPSYGSRPRCGRPGGIFFVTPTAKCLCVSSGDLKHSICSDDEAFARLPTARRLGLSSLQPQGPQLTFDFDVTGVNAVPAKDN
jgi:hypothetical protein